MIDPSTAQRHGRVLILASFLSTLGFNTIFPLLPLYVRELVPDTSAAVLWSGLAMAATPLGGALAAPFWGRLADRMGYRPMLLRALISTTIVIGLMSLPGAAWQLVALRALAGVLGSFQPVAMAALASWSRPEELSMGVGRLQMAQVAGIIVGPLIGGLATAFLGIRYAPVFGAAAVAVAVVLVARMFREPAGRRARLRGADVPFRPVLLWLPMLTLVAVQFTDSSFNPILPLLLFQGGMDPGTVGGLTGLTASLSATAAAVGSGLGGRHFKSRVGRGMIISAVALLGALILGALAAPLPWGVVGIRILVGGIVAGLAIAAYTVGGMAVLPGQRGAAYGWLSSASMAGYAASPLVAGALAGLDLRAVLVVDVLLCLITTVAWGRQRRPARAEPQPPTAPATRQEA